VSEFHNDAIRYPDHFWRSLALATSALVVSIFICAVIAVVCAIALLKVLSLFALLVQKYKY
jgi:hypothetical protein